MGCIRFICSDIAFVIFYNIFGDGKPYSETAGKSSCFVCAIESVKKFIEFYMIDILIGVFYSDHRMASFLLQRYVNVAALISVFHSII